MGLDPRLSLTVVAENLQFVAFSCYAKAPAFMDGGRRLVGVPRPRRWWALTLAIHGAGFIYLFIWDISKQLPHF
jgi:hypothetical protein